MSKTSPLLVFLGSLLLIGCGGLDSNKNSAQLTKTAGLSAVTSTESATSLITPTPTLAAVLPQITKFFPGADPIIISIRQDKKVDTTRVNQCRRLITEGNGVVLVFTDPGREPLSLKFEFSNQQSGRASIPLLGDIYADQFLFMTRQGLERALFYVVSVDPIKGAEVIILDSASCNSGGNVS